MMFLCDLSSLKKSNVSFQDIFEEVPIQLRNSNLANAALYELEGKQNNKWCCKGTIHLVRSRTVADSPLWDPKANIFDSLDLSTNPFLEKNLEFLIEYIDDLSVEQNRWDEHFWNSSDDILTTSMFADSNTTKETFKDNKLNLLSGFKREEPRTSK